MVWGRGLGEEFADVLGVLAEADLLGGIADIDAGSVAMDHGYVQNLLLGIVFALGVRF